MFSSLIFMSFILVFVSSNSTFFYSIELVLNYPSWMTSSLFLLSIASPSCFLFYFFLSYCLIIYTKSLLLNSFYFFFYDFIPFTFSTASCLRRSSYFSSTLFAISLIFLLEETIGPDTGFYRTADVDLIFLVVIGSKVWGFTRCPLSFTV
jgi:hypothetical protein